MSSSVDESSTYTVGVQSYYTYTEEVAFSSALVSLFVSRIIGHNAKLLITDFHKIWRKGGR